MMEQADVEALAASIEAKRLELVKANKAKARVHWPRRFIILGVVLVVGVVIHYAIEDTGLKDSLQSAELALSALFDSVFARIREEV
jgi:hypothetical protein